MSRDLGQGEDAAVNEAWRDDMHNLEDGRVVLLRTGIGVIMGVKNGRWYGQVLDMYGTLAYEHEGNGSYTQPLVCAPVTGWMELPT